MRCEADGNRKADYYYADDTHAGYTIYNAYGNITDEKFFE